MCAVKTYNAVKTPSRGLRPLLNNFACHCLRQPNFVLAHKFTWQCGKVEQLCRILSENFKSLVRIARNSRLCFLQHRHQRFRQCAQCVACCYPNISIVPYFIYFSSKQLILIFVQPLFGNSAI